MCKVHLSFASFNVSKLGFCKRKSGTHFSSCSQSWHHMQLQNSMFAKGLVGTLPRGLKSNLEISFNTRGRPLTCYIISWSKVYSWVKIQRYLDADSQSHLTEGSSVCRNAEIYTSSKGCKSFGFETKSAKPRVNHILGKFICIFKICLALTIKLARQNFPSKVASDVAQKQHGTITMPDISTIIFPAKKLCEIVFGYIMHAKLSRIIFPGLDGLYFQGWFSNVHKYKYLSMNFCK